MSKKIQLSIPKPCHEDWDAMTPVDKGKFCGSCQKQVVDFSNLSDRQVAEFFRKPSTGSVCGRFITDQLDREIEIPRKRIPWLKYFFSIALPAFFVSIKASASKTQGKLKVNKVTADTARQPIYADVKMMGMVSRPQSIRPFMGDTIITPGAKPVCDAPVMGKPSMESIKGEVGPAITKDQRTVTGIVLDESGKGVPYASVRIKGVRVIVYANEKGEFKIDIRKTDVLVFSNGFETKEVAVGNEDFLTIHISTALRGEVVITAGQISIRRDNEIIIKGVVVDENNNPVPFASIETTDKKITVAGEDGYFEIKSRQKSGEKKLVVTAAGYQPKEYMVGDTLNAAGKEYIRLKANASLPEVVLTGTIGLIKRVHLVGGAVSVIKIENRFEERIEKPTSENRIHIFPNPVPSGSGLSIEWKQTEEGYYNLQLINASGQSVHQKEIWIDAEARLLHIDLPAVAAGSYFLVLSNKKTGKRFTEKVIVQ